MRHVLTPAAAATLLVATLGTTPSVTHAATAPSHATRDTSTYWPTYDRTPHRAGTAAAALSTPLRPAWTRSLDGAVYGQALDIDNELIVATEHDSVYQLDPGNGNILWRRHLGRPASQNNIQNELPGCGDIFPLGITGTPAYDPKTGSVFVVAETRGGHHTLWALSAKTGKRRWHTTTDVVKGRELLAEQQRSALLVSHGHVFTTYGGLSGDCGDYVGYITATRTSGKGKTRHYAPPTAREAGMWSPAGPVVGPNGSIYVASGNGAERYGTWDKSDSVTALSPATLHRRAIFAPATWRIDNQDDLDLGSASPVPVSGRIVIAGKSGTVYLLKPNLGGVGGEIDSHSGCEAYGGAAHVGNLVIMPCHDGIRALKVTKTSIHWKWRAQGIYGSPVIAGNQVVVAHFPQGGGPLGSVSVLSRKNGGVLSSALTEALPHFPSTTVVGNHIYVGTLNGLTAIRGS